MKDELEHCLDVAGKSNKMDAVCVLVSCSEDSVWSAGHRPCEGGGVRRGPFQLRLLYEPSAQRSNIVLTRAALQWPANGGGVGGDRDEWRGRWLGPDYWASIPGLR